MTTPSTACRSWPTPWKTPAARTRRSWRIVAAGASMFEGAGWWTSSFQKTAKALAYHCTDSLPTIGVAALLRLADWCQQRRGTQGGSTSCQSPRCPPVASDGDGAAAAQGTVAAASGAPATSRRSTAQRADSPPSPRARRQGGGR